ncbi:hypothetical protein ACT3B9_003261 [Salmonella enterica]
MTATNKPMTGAQLDELMAVAMRMQSDSEKMGERSVSMFAYAVQVAVLEIRETRSKYEELQSQNAELAVQLANAESKRRELAAENAGLKAICEDRRTFIMNGVQLGYIKVPTVDTDPALDTIRTAVSPQAQTPATDTFLAEVRAQGVDASIEHLSKKFEGAGHIGVPVMALEWLAQEIRKGAAL